MDVGSLVRAIFDTDVVQVLLLVVVLDFVLGVAASFVTKTFTMTRIADTLRTDVLQRVVPVMALFAGSAVAKNLDIVIPGFDVEVVAYAAFSVAMASLTASMLKSLGDLIPGFTPPKVLALPEKAAKGEAEPKTMK